MGDKALAASHPLDEVIPGSCKDTVRRGRGEEGNASLCQIAFETQGLTHKTGIYLSFGSIYLCLDLSTYLSIHLSYYKGMVFETKHFGSSFTSRTLGWLDF